MRFRYDIERDFSKEELYGDGELPPHIRCELCDEEIYIGETYYTDISGNKYCTLGCLLEMAEVEKKKVTEEDCL